MTMVINILHKDFTLLAADRRGFVPGPFTVANSSESVTCPYDANVDYFTKIALSDGGTMAIGFAGTLSAHQHYLDYFKNNDSPYAVEKGLKQFLEWFCGQRREPSSSGNSPDFNHFFLTYLDPVKCNYVTQQSSFSRESYKIDVHDGASGEYSPSVHIIGSGNTYLLEAIGEEQAMAFYRRVKEGAGIEEIMEWLTMAFEKTAALTTTCSPTFDAVLSTRTQPVFFPITPEHPAALSFPGVRPGTIFVESKAVAPESEVATNLHKRGLKEMFINFFNRSNW